MNIHAFLFIYLYGVAAVVGIGLAIFWGRIAVNRKRQINYPWQRDRYFILATGVCLVTGGQAGIDLSRTYGNIEYGLSKILTHPVGWVVFASMLVMIAGLFFMVWLADLETHPPKWTWLKWSAVFTLVWLIASFFIHFYIPLAPDA